MKTKFNNEKKLSLKKLEISKLHKLNNVIGGGPEGLITTNGIHTTTNNGQTGQNGNP